MSESPRSVAAADAYDASNVDSCVDFSSQGLITIPEIVNSFAICNLYLQNNAIEQIPDDFFRSLPSLMWLDLRNNNISTIPETIRFHSCLSHILLQNNKLTTLPSELGTLRRLKTLQLSGNPVTYPPRDILDQGTCAILKFLKSKFEEKMAEHEHTSEDYENISTQTPKKGRNRNDNESPGASNSKTMQSLRPALSVQLSDRDHYVYADDQKSYARSEGKCPKLALSRHVLPHYAQSRKYVKPLRVKGVDEQTAKMRRCFLKELAQERYKELLEEREKILQGRKNMNLLQDWRKNYKRNQMARSQMGSCYTLDPNTIPYGTNPEHMVLLSREDLEKDLPDKYRRRLSRKSRSGAPRRSGDQLLANKIRQLFENLEKINLNRESMTPRTEQKVLLNEIHKISEIREKLTEMSSINFKNMVD